MLALLPRTIAMLLLFVLDQKTLNYLGATSLHFRNQDRLRALERLGEKSLEAKAAAREVLEQPNSLTRVKATADESFKADLTSESFEPVQSGEI